MYSSFVPMKPINANRHSHIIESATYRYQQASTMTYNPSLNPLANTWRPKRSEPSPSAKDPPTPPPEILITPLKINVPPSMDDSSDRSHSPVSPPRDDDNADVRRIKQDLQILHEASVDIGNYLRDLENNRPGRKPTRAELRALGGVYLPQFHAPKSKSKYVLQEQTQWQILEPAIKKLYPDNITKTERICPYVPRTQEQYLRHIREVRKAQYSYLEYKLKSNRGATKVQPALAFNGKQFGETWKFDNPTNRSPVLNLDTIWTKGFQVPWRVTGAWPSPAEFEWEGFSRIQTENGLFKRMFPLPRIPEGQPGYDPDYKVCSRCPALPFDDVHPVPDFESIYYPPNDIVDADVIARLLPSELLDQFEKPVY